MFLNILELYLSSQEHRLNGLNVCTDTTFYNVFPTQLSLQAPPTPPPTPGPTPIPIVPIAPEIGTQAPTMQGTTTVATDKDSGEDSQAGAPRPAPAVDQTTGEGLF